jgi:addiction module HigA family antidote
MKAPPHPADFLNEVLMPATGRSDGEIARLLGISLPVFYTILTREKPITRTTAEMLGRLFHTGVNFWLQMQADYDRHMAPQIVLDAASVPAEPVGRLVAREDARELRRLPGPSSAGIRGLPQDAAVGFVADGLPAWEAAAPAATGRGMD